jgi:cytochrome P450
MSCPFPHDTDPFKNARRQDGVLVNDFQGTRIPMILRHPALRKAARDWQTFSSDAPFRVPIPTEENVRTVRQLPLEVDPPRQKAYRAIVEPFFNRPKAPDFIQAMESLVDRMLFAAIDQGEVEIVRDFAIPLQSRALALLMNMPESEADIWIGWGTHVFREGDGGRKGAALEDYMNMLIDRAAESPGEDFFSALAGASHEGRPLTREEMLGYGSIMFAGGRDTVINSISGIIGYLSEHPHDLAFLREDPKHIIGASEEFFRMISPVTHLARVCTEGANIHGVAVDPGNMVSLCFASANYDESVFDHPDEVKLDRRPNPHVAFGFGPHLCLGAAHARLVVRSLLKSLCGHVDAIETLRSEENVEYESSYRRRLAYRELLVRIDPIITKNH